MTSDVFVCSCQNFTSATIRIARVVQSTTWRTSLSHTSISMAFLKLHSLFLYRGVVPISVHIYLKVKIARVYLASSPGVQSMQ